LRTKIAISNAQDDFNFERAAGTAGECWIEKAAACTPNAVHLSRSQPLIIPVINPAAKLKA
jgi:hypothetical protein